MQAHWKPPTECDVCGSKEIVFIDERKLDRFVFRTWPFVWFCPVCKAIVGCHLNSNSPVGYMAGSHTRKLRAELHSVFDPLWQAKLATRSELYVWLAKELRTTEQLCHIAQLSNVQLELAIKLCSRYYAANLTRIEQWKTSLKSQSSYRR